MEWCAYITVFGRTEPQSFVGSLGAPRRLFIPFGFPGLSLVGCWGFPCLPPAPPRYPDPVSAAPSPRPTLGGRPAPLRVAPLTSRRGAGGGLARLLAPRRLQDPDRSAPACCSGDPGPGRPLPLPPAALTPGSAPGPARAPALLRGPQGLSLLPGSLSVSLSVPLPGSRCLGLSIPQPEASERPGLLLPLRAWPPHFLRPSLGAGEAGVWGPLSAPPARSLSVCLLGHLWVPSVCSPARLRTAQPPGLGVPGSPAVSHASVRPCLSARPCPGPRSARFPSSLSLPPPSSGPSAPSRIPPLPSPPSPPLPSSAAANERPRVPAPGVVRRVRPRARGVGGGKPGGGRDAGLRGGGGGRGRRRPRWRRRRPGEAAGPVMRLRGPRPGASAQP